MRSEPRSTPQGWPGLAMVGRTTRTGRSVVDAGPPLRIDQASGCGLDGRLDASGDAELVAGVVEVEIHRAFAQAENPGDLGGRLAACRPGERLALTVVEMDGLRPDLA